MKRPYRERARAALRNGYLTPAGGDLARLIVKQETKREAMQNRPRPFPPLVKGGQKRSEEEIRDSGAMVVGLMLVGLSGAAVMGLIWWVSTW